MSNRAVFLDRDGTLIEEKNFLKDPDGVKLIEGATQALRLLAALRYKLFIVSNQSGVARGLMTEDDVIAVNRRVTELFAEDGLKFDGVYYCPHYPGISETCNCRKPARGMVDRALEKHRVDLAESYVIGDRKPDMELAFNTGMRAVMVTTGYGTEERHLFDNGRKPDVIVADILSAAKWIAANERS